MVSNQVQFSLAEPGPLRDLVPFAEQENRMVMAWSPLAQGLLGGKYGPDHRPGGVRAVNPLFGTENLQRIGPLLDLLRSIATRYDAQPAQVALAWLLAQPQVVVIPGASSVEQLEFNVAAAELDLDDDAASALTAAALAFRPRLGRPDPGRRGRIQAAGRPRQWPRPEGAPAPRTDRTDFESRSDRLPGSGTISSSRS